ncbi:MAG: hypothetical protein FWG21_06370, partial [Oscillospiraceae bacterium]|nr:hypothetical protein [Oscillospiraceae bacterium]
MRFLYRIVILAVIVLCGLFLLKVPMTQKSQTLLFALEDPVRDRYSYQQGYARDCLTESRQLIYDAMYAAVESYEDEIILPVSGYSETDIETVLISLLNDCPQFFWLNYSEWSYILNSDGVSILLSYHYSPSEIDSMQKKLNEQIGTLISLAEEESFKTEYEKAVYIHDAIAVMCEYDKTLNGKDIHNAYGALVEKKAVCDGYAHALQLVLTQLGIECHYVTGEARGPDGPQGHAWNIVRLDGKYTTVDLTWNDIDSYMFEEFMAPSSDITSHIYFGLSDEEMRQTHKADERYYYPLPEAVDINWFSYNMLEGPTPADIADRASDQLIANIEKTIPYVEFRLTNRD